MSLDISLLITQTVTVEKEVFEANITHNLVPMAMEAGLYQALWRPEEIGIMTADKLVPALEKGLETLKSDPERFKELNPENGWGHYDNLLCVAEAYLDACKKNPNARIDVCR